MAPPPPCTVYNKVWKGRKQLKVKFMQDIPVDWNIDGEVLSREKILTIANNEWHGREDCLPEFVEEEDIDESDIRVKFYTVVKEGEEFKHHYGLNWSLVGTDAVSRKVEDKETMFLDLSSPDDHYKKHLIVHIFGQALGLVREHQRSAFWSIAEKYLDKERMKSDLKITEEDFKTHWGEDMSLDFEKQYDPDSIMHYWFRPSWLKDEYADLYSTKEAVEKDANLTEKERKVLLRIHNRALGVVPSDVDLQFLIGAYEKSPKASGPEEVNDGQIEPVPQGDKEVNDGQIEPVPQDDKEIEDNGQVGDDHQADAEIPQNSTDPREKKGEPDVNGRENDEEAEKLRFKQLVDDPDQKKKSPKASGPEEVNDGQIEPVPQGDKEDNGQIGLVPQDDKEIEEDNGQVGDDHQADAEIPQNPTDPREKKGKPDVNGRENDEEAEKLRFKEFMEDPDHKNLQIDCSEVFITCLKENLDSQSKKLVDGEEHNVMEEVFKKVDCDCSDMKLTAGFSISIENSDRVHLTKDPMVYENTDQDMEHTYSFSREVEYTDGVEHSSSSVKGWNVTGGLTAGYQGTGASTSIGYTTQKSKTFTHSKSEKIRQEFRDDNIAVPAKHSVTVSVERQITWEACQVKDIILTFPSDLKIKCIVHKTTDSSTTSGKTDKVSVLVRDVLEKYRIDQNSRPKQCTARIPEAKCVWMKTRVGIKKSEPTPLVKKE